MKNKDLYFKQIFFLISLISIGAILLIGIFLFKDGIAIFLSQGLGGFIFNLDWSPSNKPGSYGIFPMIIGSLLTTLGAILIGGPLGLFTSVFLNYYCPKLLRTPLNGLVNLMASIPSIVYGFFGLVLLVPLTSTYLGGSGMSLLTGSILLGIMILPTIIKLISTAFLALPKSYYQGALALGAEKEIAIFTVLIPASKTGIIKALILGLGRAIGETMALVMVAGNQARMPNHILRGLRTLTTNIVIEMGYASGSHRDALIGTSLVLFLIILFINIFIKLIERKS